jgi:hypothetical protein
VGVKHRVSRFSWNMLEFEVDDLKKEDLDKIDIKFCFE